MKNRRGGSRTAPTDQGFTLLEVLIAIAIMAMILTILYQTFRGTARMTEAIELEAETYQTVQIGLSLMAQELRSAYWVKGQQDSGNTFFLGTPESLEFTTLSGHLNAEETVVPGLATIRYFLEEAPRKFGAAEEESGRLLVHEEETFLKTLMRTELGENIESLEFRYLSTEGWMEDWDAGARKALPKAVQIKMKVKDRPDHEEEFYTVVGIPIGTGGQS